MDVAMLSHSISNILQCTSSPTPLPSRLSGIHIDQLENILKQIRNKVQKHSPPDWLQKVKDAVIDLNDLMEDLRYKESITDSSESLIKTGLNIINRYQFKKAILQVNKAIEELKHLLNEEQIIVIDEEKRNSACKDFEESTKHVAVGRDREKKEIIDQLLKHSGGGEEWIQEALKNLKLIYYDDLPTYQKLCFAYCSLFPEDYLIDAERLIQLWTAEGFLSNREQFGQACFKDFVPLVFHQAEEEESDHQRYCGVVRNNYLYRMNRLMHKLARQVITGDENITVDVTGERVRDGTLRVSFNFSLDLSCEIPDSVFQTAKKLRTILLPNNIHNPRLPHEVKMTTSTCDKIFDTFKYSLRVLDLHDLGIKTVPSSIEDVKYLRYLDLSHNNMGKAS